MKYKVLCVALAVVALLVATDARKTTSNRNRGGSSGTRNTSRGKVHYPPSAPPAPSSGGFSQSRPSGGYGFSQSKPAPKAEEHRPVGWQVNNRETAVRKDVAGTQHAAYPAASNGLSGSATAQGSHSYPSSGGLSGNSPTHQQSPVQQSHSYPSNSQPGQQSGANNLHALSYPSNNQQSHTYPNSGGLSGHSGSAPPGYPSQSGGAAPGYPSQQGTHQSVPSAYPGQQGIHQSPPGYPGGATANNHPSGYPGQAGAAYPVGHANYPQQAPVYPGYGGSGYGGGYGGVGSGYSGGGYGSPGGFGAYNAYGGGKRGSSALTGLGVAGVSAGTLLTGLALWNIARSTSGSSRHTQQHNVYNTYNTYNETHTGNAASSPAGPIAPAMDPVLGELVNCTLTVSATNGSEVLAIPCYIATSVASANQEKLPQGSGTETKCIVTVVNTNGTEFTTSIPCSTLKKLGETTFPQPYSNCTLPAGLTPDPINPCMALEGDVTVIPLPATSKGSTASHAPAIDSSPAPITSPAA